MLRDSTRGPDVSPNKPQNKLLRGAARGEKCRVRTDRPNCSAKYSAGWFALPCKRSSTFPAALSASQSRNHAGGCGKDSQERSQRHGLFVRGRQADCRQVACDSAKRAVKLGIQPGLAMGREPRMNEALLPGTISSLPPLRNPRARSFAGMASTARRIRWTFDGSGHKPATATA